MTNIDERMPDWSVQAPSDTSLISQHYQNVAAAMDTINHVLQNVQNGVGELQQALRVLAEIDTGDSADVYQGVAGHAVQAAEEAQQSLLRAPQFMEEKSHQFQGVERDAISALGG